MKNNTMISDNLLRALALMQHNGEDYILLDDGRAFQGNHKEQWNEWIKCTENLPDAQIWDEFVEENCTEVEELDPEDYNNDYMVLTDEEADEKAKEYILESVWAFTPSFLASFTGFDVEIFEAIQNNGRCESNNNAILSMIKDKNEFVSDAISADGRGHFMSTYDGNENEVTVIIDGEKHTFYIYRIN